MKIAVTGASGFIGTEVIRELQKKEKIEILALTRAEDRTEGRVRWSHTDYSIKSLSEVLHGVDAVIHLAAVRGTTGTLSDYHENETITENILIAMGETGVRNIILASSIAVYSDTEKIPWREEEPLLPKTLYGITKASCEYLCHYYSKKYGFHYAAVRIAQVLGLGEKRRGMMNVFLETAYEHGEIRVMGRSSSRRQYIYVKDLAAVMSRLACMDSPQSVILNVGMKTAYSNLEIARLVNRIFENETPIRYDDSFPETIEPSHMDICSLEEYLGYEPMEMEQVLADVQKDMGK
ncbi:MAG: NAD-dependent epimerase/dehydratase family protein [Muricoprocola sp.]